MSDTPRTNRVSELYSQNREYGTYILAEHSRQLERELSAANERIAELEKAVLACNWLDMGSRAEVSLDEWEALQKLVTAPSQPTTLPESKQQK